MTNTVDFWFDPTCPWTWIASRWLDEVSGLRDLDITWRPFSLYELNAGKDVDAEYWQMLTDGRIAAQITAGVAAEHPELLADFYTELGTRLHNQARDLSAEVLAEALISVGIPEHEAEGMLTRGAEWDGLLKESVAAALELVGDDVGVPIISVAGVAFFGPVISPAPHGEQAAQLWDGCLALAKTPGFFELKRSRNVDPIF